MFPSLCSMLGNSVRRLHTKTGTRGFTPIDRFMFDLNGYTVVRGVLGSQELKILNEAVDEHAFLRPRRGVLRNTRAGKMSAKGDRYDAGGMMDWPEPHGAHFRRLLCHPRIVSHLNALCGTGYRLDHTPLLIAQEADSEGFMLHGGPLSGADGFPSRDPDRFNHELQYRSVQGQLWNTLLAMSVQLTDANQGDGGFCVVRGSHKLNYAVPPSFAHGDDPEFLSEHVYQPPTKAGDVVLFSEATVHGALPWVGGHQRRVALYRFAPATIAYGRGYLDSYGMGEDAHKRCTPEERAVLQPPYALRLDRKTLTEEGVVNRPMDRAKEKRNFDQETFRTKYF